MKMITAMQRGFSLIEMMIVVAIMGLIASIALPAYNDYVEAGQATEATSTLARLRIDMEQCFQDRRTYVGCEAHCAPANGAVHFNYACSVPPGAAVYTITASGTGDVSNYSFSVDQDNTKNSKYDGTTGNGCWLTSKTGSC